MKTKRIYRHMPSDYETHFLLALQTYYGKMYEQYFALSPTAALQLAVEQVEKLQQSLANAPQCRIAVFAGEQQPVGGIWLSRSNKNDAVLQWIWVDPPFRQQGHGRQLLAHAAELAARKGVRSLFLYAFSANVAALDLYHRSGFRPVGMEMKLDIMTHSTTEMFSYRKK